MPQVTSYLKQNTEVYQTIEIAIGNAIGIDNSADEDVYKRQNQEGTSVPINCGKSRYVVLSVALIIYTYLF